MQYARLLLLCGFLSTFFLHMRAALLLCMVNKVNQSSNLLTGHCRNLERKQDGQVVAGWFPFLGRLGGCTIAFLLFQSLPPLAPHCPITKRTLETAI